MSMTRICRCTSITASLPGEDSTQVSQNDLGGEEASTLIRAKHDTVANIAKGIFPPEQRAFHLLNTEDKV
jgi:hypothetical protein